MKICLYRDKALKNYEYKLLKWSDIWICSFKFMSEFIMKTIY